MTKTFHEKKTCRKYLILHVYVILKNYPQLYNWTRNLRHCLTYKTWHPYSWHPSKKDLSFPETLLTARESEIEKRQIREYQPKRNKFKTESSFFIIRPIKCMFSLMLYHWNWRIKKICCMNAGVSHKTNRVKRSNFVWKWNELAAWFCCFHAFFSLFSPRRSCYTEQLFNYNSSQRKKYRNCKVDSPEIWYSDLGKEQRLKLSEQNWKLTFTNESLKRIKRRKLERVSKASDVFSRYSTLSPHSSGNGIWAASSIEENK